MQKSYKTDYLKLMFRLGHMMPNQNKKSVGADKPGKAKSAGGGSSVGAHHS